MKAVNYALTWLCLLFTLPFGLLVTAWSLSLGKGPCFLFNWKAFWAFAKYGDLVK